MAENITYPPAGRALRSRIDPAERRARNRAYHGYIRNALEPTSAAVYDDTTVGDLKRMARDWADSAWEDYLDG